MEPRGPEKHGQAKRQSKACKRCTKRKQRCHGFPVCSNCEHAAQPCEQSEFALKLHRRDSSAAAFNRIQSLEAQLSRALAELSEERQARTQWAESPAASLGAVSHHANAESSPECVPIEESQPPVASTRPGPCVEDDRGDGMLNTYKRGPSMASSLEEIVQATVWTKALSSAVSDSLPLPLNLQDLKQRSAQPPTEAAGSRMLRAYFDKIHPRYPFLDPAEMTQLHAKRHQSGALDTEGRFGTFKLYMVYAIGATMLQRTGSHADVQPETFFMAALQHMSAAKQSHTLHNIEAMTLLVLYSLRSNFNSGIWYMTGLAMRTCNDLGLHREHSYPSPPTYRGELQRRLFWSVYLLERVVALSLRRPFCIAEQDIDTCLPCDVDDFVRDDETIAHRSPTADLTTSNLTMWIHFIEAKRLESHIHSEVYCLNQTKRQLLPKIEPLLSALDAWRRGLPSLSEPENDYLNLHYNKGVLLVLRPFLCLIRPDDARIRRCLMASGEVCEIFKRMHQRDSYGHSFVSAHSTFIAGITMCYCLFLAPNLFSATVSNNLRACSSTMFVMAERAPENKKHRDVLESIISRATASANMAMTHTEKSGQNLSQHDILAVQSLMDLSAHQDPSTVSTPEDRPATSPTSAQGEARASSLGFSRNTDTAVPSPDGMWDQSTRSGRKLDTHGPFHSLMESLGSSDMLMTQAMWENDAYNAQMLREMVAANGGYGGMWP